MYRFIASSLSTYDFSTLYTTLPHNLIKYLNLLNKFLTERDHFIWLFIIKSYQKVYDALHYLLGNMFMKCGLKLYKGHLESL